MDNRLPPTQMHVPAILVYHSVRGNSDGGIYGTAITPERFESHIAYLSQRYRIVPMDEFVAALASRARTQGMLAITLDDGVSDNLGAASEILKKHRAPATMYVCPGFVGRRYYWWDALHAIRDALADDSGNLSNLVRQLAPGAALPGEDAQWFRYLWDHLRRQPLSAVYGRIDALAAESRISLDGLPRPIDERELKTAATWPFTVGSHAVSHRPLTSLPLAELESELAGSRAYLEAHTNSRITGLSYPFGLYERVVALAAKDAGYAHAVSVHASPAHKVSFSDRHALMRLDPADGGLDALKALLEQYEQVNLPEYGPVRTRQRMKFRPSAERVKRSSHWPHPTELRPPKQAGFTSSPAPVHRLWGFESGNPLDRPFISRFIETHRGDVRGHVLEIKDPVYAGMFACAGARVTVLDIDPENKRAHVIDDLQTASKLADGSFDCVILTQVLQLIPEPEKAISTILRILKPGGVLLLTVPGITQTMASNGFHLAYFEPGLRQLLGKYFDPRTLLLHSHGNASLAAAFILGMTEQEVPPELLSTLDPEYPIVITARAVKPISAPDKISWPAAAPDPDVSIIVPVYNAATTIRETLHSVSIQSHRSYEVIVVDDGSTDQSRELIGEIAASSGGVVRVLAHPDGANRGLAHSRNLGLRNARGAFVVFLDADDTIHPEKLARDAAILADHPRAAAIVSRTLYWWEDDAREHAMLDMIHEPFDRIVEPPKFFGATFRHRSGGGPPCVHSWMIRRPVMKEIGEFDPDIGVYEDQKFLAELSFKFPIYVAGTCLCDYRRKSGTLWAAAEASGFELESRKQFISWMRDLEGQNPILGGPPGPGSRVVP